MRVEPWLQTGYNAAMIFLFTDFGPTGPYTGQVKAVLMRAAPAVPVIDLFLDAPVCDPQLSAYLLAAYAEVFMPGDVFLCVIDPTSRSPAPNQLPLLHSLGSPAITQYTVKCVASTVASPSCASPAGAGVISTTVAVGASPLQASFTSLVPGTSYVCYAIADNGVGGAQCSSASSSTTIVSAPDPATIGTASTPAAGQILVPFTAPVK